jgi:riboflavin synthase alpha subunit
MHASFAEKSVWIQLISLAVGLALYVVGAGSMLLDGVSVLTAYMPVFAVAVVFIVAVNVAGHIALAVASRPDGPDERDRLIGWRTESVSSWILGAGVLIAIGGMTLSVGEVWVAHLLLLSLFLAEITKDIAQLVYYRRGMSV